MNKCEKCGFLHYRTDPCRAAKKSEHPGNGVATDQVGRESIPRKKSTAARMDVPRLAEDRTTTASGAATEQWAKYGAEAGTQALPVDTPKRGRPRIHADRKAYKAMKERERRDRLKAEKETGK